MAAPTAAVAILKLPNGGDILLEAVHKSGDLELSWKSAIRQAYSVLRQKSCHALDTRKL
jgi:hypothetical protein